jgi:hypothetical protein
MHLLSRVDKPILLTVSLLVAMATACTTTRKLRAKIAKYQKLEVYGGYHPQEVGLAFRKVHPALNECHKQAGSPVGRIVFQYRIRSETGEVADVKVLKDHDTLENPSFQECAVKAVESMKYDKMNAGNDTKVIYPVSFPL